MWATAGSPVGVETRSPTLGLPETTSAPAAKPATPNTLIMLLALWLSPTAIDGGVYKCTPASLVARCRQHGSDHVRQMCSGFGEAGMQIGEAIDWNTPRHLDTACASGVGALDCGTARQE
jgi:hypothetical protein